jgi:hypothetical protein
MSSESGTKLVPAPLTDRDLLIARLIFRDTLNLILNFNRAGYDVRELCLKALEKPSGKHETERLEALLAEHERTTRGQVLDADS